MHNVQMTDCEIAVLMKCLIYARQDVLSDGEASVATVVLDRLVQIPIENIVFKEIECNSQKRM